MMRVATGKSLHVGPILEIAVHRFRLVLAGLGPVAAAAAWAGPVGDAAAQLSRPVLQRFADGRGEVRVAGDFHQWHKVTVTLDGPYAAEDDTSPNPFTDYCMTVEFRHESGKPSYRVPGYFAADGQAADSSASSGTAWRAHLAPDVPGKWTARIGFVRGLRAAVDPQAVVTPMARYDGQSVEFQIRPTDKVAPDLRAEGRLEYVGQRYLRFAGSGRFFLKAGADAPETLLAYGDFDGTYARRSSAPVHSWQPHVDDWRPGDPVWKEEKGKGLIGAVNYLSDKGCNAVSFLTYNAGGDGDNVWPFIAPDAKLHYDCSKLDQWQVVLDHAQSRGLFLHFKLQETENDDDRLGGTRQSIPAALDGGRLGIERRLYCRELIARFAYLLALNWNLGEENTQSADEQRAMAEFLHETDPYHHPIVVHTYPNQQDRVYGKLLGNQSVLTGASLQNSWDAAHRQVFTWVRRSADAGRPWVVACDEQNPANLVVPPDPQYVDSQQAGHQPPYDLHSIRKATLWGTLLAGGAGVEYYFGYDLPQNDLVCEDFRSRDRSWDFCRIALELFYEHGIPFSRMQCMDELVGNSEHDNRRYCFGRAGEIYLVYLPSGGQAELNLEGDSETYRVQWYNPREGGRLAAGAVTQVDGGKIVRLGLPPDSPDADWLVVIRR